MLKFFNDVIHRLESSPTPFRYTVLTFIAAITLRSYLEPFSTKNTVPLIYYIHYSFCYLTLALSLIILFYFATREAVDKITKVVFPSFIILNLVPIADLFLSFGKGYGVTYIMPDIQDHLLRRFFCFFGTFNGQEGVSPGQRIEIALVILLSYVFIYVKTKKVLRSVIFAFLAYVVIFFYLALPLSVTTFFNALGISFSFSNEVMIRAYLLLLLPLTQVVFYLYNKQYFFEIWKDSRPLRIAHYLLMVILGFVFTLNSDVQQFELQFFWIFIPPAIIFAWAFAVMVNNREDYDIDKISNKGRPTVLKSIPSEHYMNISWLFFVLALIYASAVSYICFFIILLWMCNYFLYSSPPFRLKRVPFFSKLVISLNSLLLFELGYSLAVGNVILPLPGSIVLFFLVCFTAVINFIDIKDYLGDKSAGIKTLPTLLGLEKSKLIIGFFFLISYPLTYFLLKDRILLLVMAATGLIIFVLINRKNYTEWPVFIAYLFSVIFLIGDLFIRYWFNIQ